MIEDLKNPEEIDALVRAVWKDSEAEIVKRVEWAVTEQFRQYAHSRASQLVRAEVDAILKPKLASMREVMEQRAQKVIDDLLPRLDVALESGLTESVNIIADNTIREMLSNVQRHVRETLHKALTSEKE